MDYKKEKENWVSGHSGGSILEINSITGVLLTSYILWSAISKSELAILFNYNNSEAATNSLITKTINIIILEFLILVLPSILACTILSSYTFYLNLLFIIISFLISSKYSKNKEPKKKKQPWEKDSDEEEIDNDNSYDENENLLLNKKGLNDNGGNSGGGIIVIDDDNEKLEGKKEKDDDDDYLMNEKYIKKKNIYIYRKPFLTAYRSSMVILTCICILAVDFKVFPRRFAKVEDYGTSLMDLGVGSFVFSSGIVSAKPFLKKPENRFKPMKGQLVAAVKHSLPILALGILRLIAVKSSDYQEHVTEYGKHWNFFFTLGFLPIFVTLCRTFQKYTRFSIVGLTIAILYQIVLSKFGLEEYIQNAPRINLINDNKEGLSSFWGS
ncbi:7636_t:CDS:2 [Entrophospora sp. SA101]|nr:7636_t:CDS:2 [Entrophospora sp. SA101]CAJ0832515.1 12067_t:CDS:2 [Entrophospora sp. SA101]CAJ0862423.1 1753_t:CDS:2 [Entrophospora sp. SA101]CAJ0863358.1 832_t:CDS:2 [Entrophospora sp. SA101]CAJ0869383.1 1462_t:CDS:2 [Entrophospora sp. SA101]